MGDILNFDPIYYQHLKMWNEDRWKFSGKLVNLTIKLSREGLNEEEQHIHDILNRIVTEHNNEWLEQPKKRLKKG